MTRTVYPYTPSERPARVTKAQISCAIVLGSAALLMLGVQPLVLDGLVTARKISVAGVGRLSTIELLSLALTIFLAVRYLPETRLRHWGVVGCVALAAANAATGLGDGVVIVFARIVAGAAAGILVWLVVCICTRSVSPGRVTGVFLTAQTVWQAVVAEFLSVFVMPDFGVGGAFLAMGLLTLCALPAVAVIPSMLTPLSQFEADPDMAPQQIRARGWIGLSGCLLYTAGIVGIWVFIETIGELSHLNAYVIGSAASVVLLAQIFGSTAATVLERMWPAAVTLAVADFGMIVAVWALGTTPSQALYIGCICLFGFLWMMALPFQVRLLIDIDPSRRTSMQLSSAQLFGSALGPAVTSAFVTSSGLGHAIEADMALFLLSMVLTSIAARASRSPRTLPT